MAYDPQQQRRGMSSVDYLANLARQINAISANLAVVQQKLTYIGRNERVLNKNMILINSKMKDLEQRVAAGAPPAAQGASTAELSELKSQVQKLSLSVQGLERQFTELKDATTPLDAELRKLKHLVDVLDFSKK
ncbi:MAG TPA: hypothetical protein VJA40_04265 [archaeon]|nr:hypothetical protein [archaeon]